MTEQPIMHRGVALPLGLTPEAADALERFIVDTMDDALLSDRPALDLFEAAMAIVREVEAKVCPSLRTAAAST